MKAQWVVMVAFIAVLVLVPIALADNMTNSSANNNHQFECTPNSLLDPTNVAIVVILIMAGTGFLLLGTTQAGNVTNLLRIAGVIFLLFAVVYSLFALEVNTSTINFGAPGSARAYADFSVMVNNQLVDFTSMHYMSYKGEERSVYVQINAPDSVVHVYATGVTWKYFFHTLGVTMNDTCLSVQGKDICGATFLVNGKPVSSLDIPIHDGDRALFHYGTGNASVFFEQAVGNNSCLYSGTCPERGVLNGCSSLSEANEPKTIFT